MSAKLSRILRATLAAVLMAIAANSFLKYLWWAACYSAWYGLPKMPWKAAGARASFYGWSVILLEFATVALLVPLLRLPSSDTSSFFRNALRLILSCIVA